MRTDNTFSRIERIECGKSREYLVISLSIEINNSISFINGRMILNKKNKLLVFQYWLADEIGNHIFIYGIIIMEGCYRISQILQNFFCDAGFGFVCKAEYDGISS